MSAGWPGCHGVRLSDEPPVDVGHSTGTPIVDASLEVGEVAAPVGEELWRLSAAVDTATGPVEAEQRLWLEPDGSSVLRTNRGAALAVDPRERTIRLQAPEEGTLAQLTVTYGFPLLLAATDVVVVHAAAAARDGQAVLIAGPSGSGKSSTLVGLVDAGWQAVSEDLCAIDLRDEVPRVWPGPPWVRRLRGEPGPAGATSRFETIDKVAWDIGPAQITAPVPVALLAVVSAGGGDAVVGAVDRSAAPAVLADHVVWLGRSGEQGRSLFPRLLRLSARVPVVSLQVPRSATWLSGVPGVFAELLAGAT